jgi:hypothetical protein
MIEIHGVCDCKLMANTHSVSMGIIMETIRKKRFCLSKISTRVSAAAAKTMDHEKQQNAHYNFGKAPKRDHQTVMQKQRHVGIAKNTPNEKFVPQK